MALRGIDCIVGASLMWPTFSIRVSAPLDSTHICDVSAVTLTAASLDISPKNGQQLLFKPDGTVLWVIDSSGLKIYQYTLSTGWDLSTATYNSQWSYNGVPSGIGQCYSMATNDTGTKLYLIDVNEKVFEYTCSPWSVATAAYASKSFDASTQITTNYSPTIAFSTDGTKMYLADRLSPYYIYQYTLSTAWDVSTASYASKSYYWRATAADMSQLDEIQFASDGLTMLAVGYPADGVIYQYTLSTAWDVSTISYTGKSKASGLTPTGSVTVTGLFLRPDCGGFFVFESQGDVVREYTA